MNPILSNRQESFSGSRFAQDLENIVDLDIEGGLKMLIRVDLIESTQIVQIDWSLWPRFKNEEGSCIVFSRILTSGGLCRVGWKCCRFDSIRSNQHESFPLLSICHTGSRFARRDSVQIQSRCSVRIELNYKVPQTNRLSLGVLDMDMYYLVLPVTWAEDLWHHLYRLLLSSV